MLMEHYYYSSLFNNIKKNKQILKKQYIKIKDEVDLAVLKTIEEGNDSIQLQHLIQGIKKEYVKEGKMM